MKNIALLIAFGLLIVSGLSFSGMLDDGGLISDPPKYSDGNLTIPGTVDANSISVKDASVVGVIDVNELTVGGEAASTDFLVSAAAGNKRYVHPGMSNAEIQAVIEAAETEGGWTATNRCRIEFEPGEYTDLNLTIRGDYITLAAGESDTVLAGTITAADSPTGLYIYLWDHPSGTYPASLSLVDYAEVY